jgi:hypothetical protein
MSDEDTDRESRIHNTDEWRTAISTVVLRLVQFAAVADKNIVGDIDLSPIIQMASAKPNCTRSTVRDDIAWLVAQVTALRASVLEIEQARRDEESIDDE